jgi:NB-ARC domain/WD domain, G-beta repeat
MDKQHEVHIQTAQGLAIGEHVQQTNYFIEQYSSPNEKRERLGNRASLGDQNSSLPTTFNLFMAGDQPADFVPRPKEFEELISILLDGQSGIPNAFNAALRGAGGYGKTTMAKAICHDERIKRRFKDGNLWVTLGEKPSDLIGKIGDLIYMLSAVRPAFASIDAAAAKLSQLLEDCDILLVIDDVWNTADLKPFLQGGRRCARLITTRDNAVLPINAICITLDAMRPEEAVLLLDSGLQEIEHASSDIDALYKLAARQGEWPLLLKLTNGVLRGRVSKKQSLSDALLYINTALDRRGPVAFDARKPKDRNQAVEATLSVSFELLAVDEYKRYREIAIFPEDIDIPLGTLQRLWMATGRLDDFDTEDLCERLQGISLLLKFDPTTRVIRLHDVIRDYLRQEAREELAFMNTRLLDAYELERWAELPNDEPYLWDHLAYHLIEAGRNKDLTTAVKDLRYLAAKSFVRSTHAVEIDLAIAEKMFSTDVVLGLLRRNIATMGHLLNSCMTLHESASVLLSRLSHLTDLSDLCQNLESEIPPPFLFPWRILPDIPHSALVRTLLGHTKPVNACAFSPLGDFIVSASADQTLKIWDASSGMERLTLRGHTGPVIGCAISPMSDFVVSASVDCTLKVWDSSSGTELLTLLGHTKPVNSCVYLEAVVDRESRLLTEILPDLFRVLPLY